jgi:hypothetical protein
MQPKGSHKFVDTLSFPIIFPNGCNVLGHPISKAFGASNIAVAGFLANYMIYHWSRVLIVEQIKQIIKTNTGQHRPYSN